MAHPRAAWGIDIGADALKAIRLERDGDAVAVSDFIVIPHKKVLTTPDVDQNEMVRLTLGQFISQKALVGEHLVMSVPGHAAFARFAKLPPVEPKKVPDIVKFEAVQQIPFPIDEVEWDYQIFQSDDSPELEVGIFAITRERVRQRLSLYGELGLSPESLTLSPVAVFNAMSYDLALDTEKGPVVFLDIGSQATDVIIADGGRCWIRTFPLGGNHFTEAIANAFKLSYSKAEKLKREASTSKYAKQIMQAMRPVFSDLLQDLQRSIGYYQSLHRERPLRDMVGIGSTFKIPGLRKFIGQQLQIEVARLDEFRRISVTGREAAAFAEHAVNMATAYGLALQGVGMANIDANLVPVRILREQLWRSKSRWFAAAAAIFVAGAATSLYHPLVEGPQIAPGEIPEVASAIAMGQRLKSEFDEARNEADIGARAINMSVLLEDRDVWPWIVSDASAALASANPQPALLGDDPAAIRAIPVEQRRLIELESLDGNYAFDPEAKKRRIEVRLDVRLTHRDPVQFVTDSVGRWLAANTDPSGERAGAPYRIVPDSIRIDRTLLAEAEVQDDGTLKGQERAAGGSSQSGGGFSPPGRRESGGTRTPPGASGLGSGSGSSTPGMGSGLPGRRQTGSRRAAPGAGAAGLGAGDPASGGSTFGGPGFGGDAGGGTTGGTIGGSGGDDREEAVAKDLESLAPIDGPEPYFSKGDRVYRIPVTFTIEIIDASAPAPVDQAMADDGREHAG